MTVTQYLDIGFVGCALIAAVFYVLSKHHWRHRVRRRRHRIGNRRLCADVQGVATSSRSVNVGSLEARIGLECWEFEAEWDLFGASAGELRNKEILDRSPQGLVVFGDDVDDMCHQTAAAGVPIWRPRGANC